MNFLVLFVVTGGLAMATMFNAPAIFVGYGFAFIVMLLAAWMFKPRTAFVAILASTLIALPIMILTKATFTEVAILNVLVRAPVAYLASEIRWRKGLLSSTFALSVFESLIALLIAILYFGDDGIHTSLSIFGILLAPFGYLIYLSVVNGERLRALAGIVCAAIFYFSTVTFPVLLVAFVSVLSLAALLKYPKYPNLKSLVLLVLIATAVFGLVYDNSFRNNVKVTLYPFFPHNWGDERWMQTDPACPPMDNVFVHTHTPSRLRIVETCVEVVGKVEKPPFIAGDGDYCFDVIPNDKSYLGIGNYILRKGGLHIEVVPADQLKVLSGIQGICPGDVVRVRGVWVVDTDHGMWTEVHPASVIEVIESKSKVRWPECVLGREFEE
ncbi:MULTISPECIES: hypothetical protein [unclassified Archaeoglobus]|jgi:hypothetical protein|uniref:hypothetical protein n=1 Tax=unclassified Archaeoglobus TaxID=2643606 RepID=UPI0025C0D1B9|nr:MULTISPECIES: hypothetical protein [unclassified Archaeoglobus]